MKTVEEHVLTDAQVKLLRRLVEEHMLTGSDAVSPFVSDLDEVLSAEIHGGKQVITVRYEQ